MTEMMKQRFCMGEIVIVIKEHNGHQVDEEGYVIETGDLVGIAFLKHQNLFERKKEENLGRYLKRELAEFFKATNIDFDPQIHIKEKQKYIPDIEE